MVVGLLDSSIIVDLIRGFPPSHRWLQTSNSEFGVTYYVWLEVIEGAPNKQKQKAAIELLSDLELISTTSEDVLWAVKSLTKINLTHNVDVMDSLIASTAFRLQIPLYTRNLKHFQPLLGQFAQKPY